jgi:hypothetical protein
MIAIFFCLLSSILALQDIELIDLKPLQKSAQQPKWNVPRRACDPEPPCQPCHQSCPQFCSFPSSTSSTSSCSSSSSSTSCDPERKQEFIYEFLTPKGNRELVIKAYGNCDGELEIWDLNRDVRIYNSRRPCGHRLHLKPGRNNLKFVYTSCEQVTPTQNMAEPGCTCDSLRTRLTLGRFVIYWCSEKSPFFDTKMMTGLINDKN